MKLLYGLVHTPGTYAGLLGIFVAVICYRANPLRAAIRVVATVMLILAAWQVCLALIAATGNVLVWAGVSLFLGAAGLVYWFLLHDACIHPQSTTRMRLRRTWLGWIVGAAHITGGLCKTPMGPLPPVYPFAFRVIALSALLLGVYQLRKQRRAARTVSAGEMFFFKLIGVFVPVWVAVFMLLPGPLSAWINALLAILFFAIVVGLLLTGRIFDVGETAKVAAGHILSFALFIVLLVPLARAAGIVIRPTGNQTWDLVIVVAALSFPLAAASDWLTRQLLPSITITEHSARRTAFRILRAATSETEVINTIGDVAKRYLRGIAVRVRIEDESVPPDVLDDADVALAGTTRKWLSPEIAVRQFRGAELDLVLDQFAHARLGAVVRYIGRKITVVLFVGQRGGGSKPIVSAELEFLYELAMAAGTSIDRLRAIDDMFKSRRLATAGRLAADFSHSARNQIAAILALVEAVRNGDSAQLTPEYRDAVYQETLALAANHNMAAEIARLDGENLNRRPLSVSAIIASVVESCGHITRQLGGRISTAAANSTLIVAADDRLFRQVLLNILRNALQACAGTWQPPDVTIRTWSDGTSAFVDIIDNGPGVSEHVHDRLFTPWATTKADGTGLGLPFCLEAMRKLQGTVIYLTPRGQPHAWFQLRLPLANSDEFCTALHSASVTSIAPLPV